MLCINDISQNILYDSSKAEGELLTLINSTISHEMRNPLNSIINQCQIMKSLSSQFSDALNEVKHEISKEVFNELIEIFGEYIKSI